MGGPAFPLEAVVALAKKGLVYLTRRASTEGARFLGVDEAVLRGLVYGLLEDLEPEEWHFKQELEGRWVDVYRIELEDWPPMWIKLRLEEMKKREVVMVITLHEFKE